MRARRLSRLAGLVLALAALGLPVLRSASGGGGYSTLDFDWGAPSANVVIYSTSGSGAGSTAP